jgi:hypothetical protein
LGDTHQWSNKHLLPPLIKEKQKNLEDTPHMKALVKWVTEHRWAGLDVCHCDEEFILQ